MNIDKTQLRELRLADLRTAIILLILAIAILAEASTFPMTDSWGGVENVWYVSPALFPLVIGCLLLILAMVLLVTAYRSLISLDSTGFHWKTLIPAVLPISPRGRDTLFIIGLLIFYVYLLIPAVDFFLATTLFQATLTIRFLFDCPSLNRQLAAAYLTLLPVVLLVFFFYPFDTTDNQLLASDTLIGCFTLVLLALPLRMKFPPQDRKRRYSNMLLATLLIPLLLTVGFQYFMLVPMPTEGTIIQMMDYLRYDLFD
ncbi:tripartite tricarboxylate transporter TctB family protein [Aestuariirhabdus sp. LZHN29]|uniref:tripartite tricarboxylate transporter TctB family protein n=1 Tax=Aestuariirhabdus sp. LZHN29 TaxID=3417462 RepID=UPI003CF81218